MSVVFGNKLSVKLLKPLYETRTQFKYKLININMSQLVVLHLFANRLEKECA